MSGLEVGYDVAAAVGMAEAEIATPALIVDLDAFERNLQVMAEAAKRFGVAHRAHAKTHRSVDVARAQMALGGAVGVCCQKVAEAEALARGGIDDILVSNQVVDPAKIDRLVKLPEKISVLVDDIEAIAPLSAACERHGRGLGVLVEVECGQKRCGVLPEDVVGLARAVTAAPGLTFEGIQVYQGGAQQIRQFAPRSAAIERAVDVARGCVAALAAAGIPCPTVTGAGTGSFEIEAASGVYTELQTGSYCFMDASYLRNLGEDGLPYSPFEPALFVLTSVMSVAGPGRAICDAGLKSMSAESGLPMVHGRADVHYQGISDEHGNLADPGDVLRLNDRLRLVPGHCDPTCNLHDHYVAVRGGVVEAIWPVSARGRSW